MKTKMKLTRLWSFLLTLVMVAGLLSATSLTAYAEATGTGTEADPYIVTDYDELRDLMMNTPINTIRYIKLGSDISYSESTNDHSLTLKNAYQSVVLDLNGYTISRSGKTTDTGVVSLTIGKLTIRDSSTTGTGKIKSSVTAGETQATLVNSSNSSLIIEGGTFEVNAGRYAKAIYTLGGITEIYGGTFIANTSDGNAASFIYGTVYVDGGTFLVNRNDSTGQGLYIYDSSSTKVYLYNCTVIGGRLVLNGTAIPDGCSRSDTTIDGKSAVVIQAEDGVGVVKSLSATVENPLEGANPATVAVAGDSRYTATIARWYKGGTADHPGSEILIGHTFEGGETYVVEVRFTQESGEFFRSDISAAINGAEGFHSGSGADESIMFRVAFKVPADIKEVVMTSDISTPGIGCAVTTPTFTVTEGNPVYVRGGNWQKYDDTSGTWSNYSGETFKAGKYRYSTILRIKSADCENYLMNYDVTATVNGNSWNVDNKITLDGTNKLVQCTAYSPEYTAIADINTVDVTIREPLAGAFPQNAVSHTDNVSVGITAWWHNGVKMSSSDYFVAGETYKVHVIVYPDSGYGFADSPTVTFNGSKKGTVYLSGVEYINYYAEFTAVGPTIIDAVDVKVTKPVAGAHPQDVVSNTDHAIVTAMEWRCDGKRLSASDTFEEGVTYQLTVVVGVDSNKYEFSDDTIITFNGANTGKYVTNDYDYVIYDVWFTATAASAGVTVSGTATSFGSATDNVTVQLIASGESTAAYETVVKGNSASYTIEGVAPGTYTMKVMKNNHVTREYTVTVSTENVTQDVKIHLKGDITGDGKVNTFDIVKMNLHAKKKTELTGYELLCGDITGDGKVNTFDIVKANLHAKKKTLLW